MGNRSYGTLPAAKGTFDHNPRIRDVTRQVADLRQQGDYLALNVAGEIPGKRYTPDLADIHDHFQGIQRLRAGNYIALSGGDPPHDGSSGESQVFIAKMGSRRQAGAWRSSTVADGGPRVSDKIISSVTFDKRGYWHAGGISVLGDVLAVPIESDVASRIQFLDVSDPTQPKRIPPGIDRPALRRGQQGRTNKAGAVAMTKLDDGKPSSKKVYPHLDLYLSTGDGVATGFGTAPPRKWDYLGEKRGSVEAEAGQTTTFRNYQAIQFARDTDGALYLVGTHNTQWSAPVISGENNVDVFRVDFPKAHGPHLAAKPVITKVGSRTITCEWGQCNLNAAGGVHLADGRVRLYSSAHWRDSDDRSIIRFSEYRPPLDVVADNITEARDGWIELFEHTDFEGRFLSIRGARHRDTDFTDYEKISVQGAAFSRAASSVQWQLPPGADYVLYDDKGYGNEVLRLRGTGHVRMHEDLHSPEPAGRDAGDKILSSKYIKPKP